MDSQPPQAPQFVPVPEGNSRPPIEPSPGIKVPSILLAALFILLLAGGLVVWLALPMLSKKGQGEETKIMAGRVEAAKPKTSLTEAEKAAVLEFGNQLAAHLTAGSGSTTRDMVDYEIFADRVCMQVGSSFGNLAERRDELVKVSERTQGGFFTALIGCRVKNLRVTSRDGFPALRLRALDETNGLRYYDVLVRIRGNDVKAVDVFNFTFASFVTMESADTLRFMMVLDDTQQRQTPAQAELAKQEAVKSMTIALRLDNAEGVITQYQELPTKHKSERVFFRMYLQALMLFPEPSVEKVKLQREALANAERILGKDSTSALTALDLQMENGDFAGAESGLRATEALVGHDGYLTALRGLVLLKQNKLAEAEQLRDEAAAMEPDLDVLANLRRLIYAVKKDYASLVNDLRAYQAKSKRRLSRQNLAQQPEFADFLKSPEFAQWEREMQ